MSYQSVLKPDLFKQHNIIVTGGGSGIGRCTAHELASLGANVAIVGRSGGGHGGRAQVDEAFRVAHPALEVPVLCGEADLAVAPARSEELGPG